MVTTAEGNSDMTELGHVVLYVRELERSRRFYQRVVGLEVVAEIFGGRAAVLTRISHQDPGFWGDRGKQVERSFEKA
jgi:catechol 2,3-dioxygenase-like lactoylglutathione lyase family enzyme